MPTTLDLVDRFSTIIALQQEVLSVASEGETTLMSLIARRAAEITGGDGSVFELVHGQDLVYRAASGPAQRFLGAHIPIEKSLSGLSIRERDVLFCDDAETDSRVDAESCRDIGIRSMVVAPLTDHERVIGVLKVYSARKAKFDDYDINAVRLIAGMASSALMLAGQFRERKTSEERFRLLFERNVAGVFRTTLDGRILDCNDAFVRSLGYGSRQELLEIKSTELYARPGNRQEFLEILHRQRSMTNVRIPLKRKDGSAMAGLVNVSLIPGDGDELQLLGTLVEEEPH